ncbi:MAG TPA: hypothetical protein VMW08_12925 [Acidimicrobiales bacterium]|nr:hypothetical protein [Acidimicrobiales bacterium]
MRDPGRDGVSALAVRRRRVRGVDMDALPWVADDLVITPDRGVVATFESDRTWCLPSAGDQHRAHWRDPLWRALDRWSRAGSVTVRGGAPDVYRVVRLPAEVVATTLAQWPDQTLVAGRSSLALSRAGDHALRGVFAPAGARRAEVEIAFERWSRSHLCAHFRPVGRSSRRSGSVAWWSAAHALLDELVVRLSHFESAPLSQ